MRPKDIPPNVWRTSLNEDDWNFLQVQNDEWPQCLVWELRREKVQAEAGGKFPTEKNRVPERGEDLRIMRVKIAMGKRAGRFLKQDWTSYLSRRKKENWKRLPKFECDQASWIGLDWRGLREHWREHLEDCDTILDGDGKTEILPFKIPWGWRNDEIQFAFAQWLKQNRPTELPEPPPPSAKPTGAGSLIRQSKKNLKALAAWRLIQHHNGSHIKAYAHNGAFEYLGDAYNHAGEWTDAKKTVQTALGQIHILHREAVNFASTKND
jgi:hypothetical protein